MDIAEVLTGLSTSESGIPWDAVEDRLSEYGPNEISRQKIEGWYVLFLKNFYNPFVGLLVAFAAVSFFLQEIQSVIILSVMIGISVLVRFSQEYRASRSFRHLSSLVQNKTTIRRDGVKQDVIFPDVVPGDIVLLSAGDMVPADVRLVTARDLFISQSALTGESLPIEKNDCSPFNKTSNAVTENVSAVLDLQNIVLMGTSVVSGTATGIVVGTGDNTVFGTMARSVLRRRAKPSFELGVNSVSWMLICFVLVMVPIVLLLTGLTKGSWLEAALFALSVGVGLTPEMLPPIVSANLALGAVRLSKKQVIVKRSSALQDLGAMDILCTDKTGTLTEDKVILEYHLNLKGDQDDEVLEYAYLNSYHQTGLKSLLDIAILEHQNPITAEEISKRFFKTDEIPFDFERRRMSVAVHQVLSGKDLLITKGAVDELLSISSQARIDGTIIPLDDKLRKEILEITGRLNDDGLRVVAVAYRELFTELHRTRSVSDEKDMIIVGYIAFLDPPKDSAIKAIKGLNNNGVRVKVLSGDNEIITRRVCRWVGMDVDELMTGDQIDRLTDDDLAEAAQRISVFARINPLQKARIVNSLKQRGHVVGYLGDGINDAAALREADVGISVNTAVDIAKESADVVLLEKSLLVLEEGVYEGRRMFGNIIKYVKIAASSNFGNVLSVVGASVVLPFLPMKPIQLLTQNLLYDLSQTAIPFDNVDKDFLESPRKWDSAGISRFMLLIGPISSVFDFVTFAMMWYIFKANSPSSVPLFQTGWFIEALLSQLFIVHLIRTRQIPFLQNRAAAPLMFGTLAIAAIGLYLPYSAFGNHIGLVMLPGSYFFLLTIILLSYGALMYIVKQRFIERFGYWL